MVLKGKVFFSKRDSFKVKRYIIEEVDVIKGYVVYWLDYLGVKRRYKCRLDDVKKVWFSEDGKFLEEFLR